MNCHEDCAVCFASIYEQNDSFMCRHPLCINCYSQLHIKRCPICRSSDRYDIFELQLSRHGTFFVEAKYLTGFVIHSFTFRGYMNRFLKIRLKPDIVLKANKHLKFEKFILLKGHYFNLADLYNRELVDLIMNHRFNETNTTIIKSMLLSHRMGPG